MEKELVVQESTEILSLDFIEMRVNKIQEIMSKLMKNDVHYGTIPGCGKKKGLFKAGAEVLCVAFQLQPSYEYEIIDLGNQHREYRFTGKAVYIPTGAVIAQGVGSCSTMEVKYRYRESLRKCPACGQETIIKGKEEYGGGWVCFAKKGGCGKKFKTGDQEIESQTIGRIENPDIADQYNTVFKMGKKRCHTDLTLSATGASFLFTQGEDTAIPKGNKETPPKEQPPMSPPQSKSEKDEKACPGCGNIGAVIKDQYGGGWLCFNKKGGCGHKWGGDTSQNPATPNDELAKDMRHIQAMLKEFNPNLDSAGKRKLANKALKMKFPDMEELKSMSNLTQEYAKELISHLNNLLEMKKETEA